MGAIALSGSSEIQPVELVFVQQCHFKAKACKICGLAKTNPVHQRGRISAGSGHKYSSALGCAKCGLFRKDRAHLELAPSLNILGSGRTGGGHVYDHIKAGMEEIFAEALEQSGLPRGLKSVIVEAQVTFGDTKGRDEGNIRFFIEKSLGDALVGGYGYSTGSKAKDDYEWHQVIEGGWLPDDTFYPTRRYTFGGLDARYDPQVVTMLRLMILPELGSHAIGQAGEGSTDLVEQGPESIAQVGHVAESDDLTLRGSVMIG